MEQFTKTIANIVAEDYRTAAVFSKYGIDFCCKGNRPLGTVCENANIDAAALRKDLAAAVNSSNAATTDYRHLPTDLLIDFIEKKFHREIREKTPVLLAYLEKTAKVHGAAHPELLEVFRLFAASAEDLEVHMLKEENVLFPFIRQLLSGAENSPAAHFGTVKNPIAAMQHEHETEGDRFRTIAELTDNYNPPAGACNTYKVAYAMLQAFQTDLHLHIHLENNILYPKAIELEEGMLVH